ncbi:MAG: TlpA disulfide reductase family protein [Dokdonella sp.]
MFDRTTLLIIALAVGGALAGLFAGAWLRPAALPTPPAADAPAIGSQRQDIHLPDTEGHVQSLAQWNGKLILLNFWASWCGPCREEMPLLEQSQQRLAARGLQIVGIADDSASAAKNFLAGHPVSYPILIDDPDALAANGPDVSAIYGNTRNVLPYSVLIGRDGRIVAKRFGNFTQSSLDQWLTPHL